MSRTKEEPSVSNVMPLFQKITATAKKNLNFRHRVMHGKFSELVEMSIMPGNELGEEMHKNGDEILFVVQGKCVVTIDGVSARATRHCAIFVQSGTRHNLRNIGRGELKLLCVCSPPFTAHTGTHREGELAAEGRTAYAWEQ